MSSLGKFTATVGVAVAVSAFATPAQAATQTHVGPLRPMIIDGGMVDSAPWAARVFADGKEKCSGTIIAPNWVLTAQHCGMDVKELTFHIGDVDQTKGQEAKGAEVHNHPDADLMLVKLDRDIDTEYAKLGSDSDVNVGDDGKIYGWGATCTDKPAEDCQSQQLKYADVKVKSFDCKDHWEGPAICAEKVNGISNNGDSGGPLRVGDLQVGLLSSSDHVSLANYVNVTKYRDWISDLAGV